MAYRRHDELRILQLNVEDFTRTKESILEHLAAQNQADALLLQETHQSDALLLQETHQSEPSKLKLRGYCLVSYTPNTHYGLATFTKVALWRPNCQRAQPTKR